MAARLRISRLPGLLDRYRRWDIVVDGEVAGAVANGHIVDVVVDHGPHSVRVGHRLWASPVRTFEIRRNQTVEFVCRPRPHPMVWIPYGVASLLRHDLFMVLEPVPPGGAVAATVPVRAARRDAAVQGDAVVGVGRLRA